MVADRFTLVVLVAFGAGCGSGSTNPFATGAGTAGADATGTSGGGESSADTTMGGPAADASSDGAMVEDGDSSTGASVKLDVGFSTSGGPERDGCQKIDFLFVIDNSGSMLGEQQQLIDAFPGFIASIQDTVAGSDHHIMVIDSDDNPAWACEVKDNGGHCSGVDPTSLCDDYQCGDVDGLSACDLQLGAGVTSPYGGSASNADCNFPDGRRYLTEQDADLLERFTCAASVGVSGNFEELPGSALAAALAPGAGSIGGCNEGFLRDDAILVVTFLTDDIAWPGDIDDASDGDPIAWYDTIVAAKNGDPQAIVFIGFIPDGTHATGNASCVIPSDIFVDFGSAFGNAAVVASICEPDYAAVFDEAVALIDTACEEFEPPE